MWSSPWSISAAKSHSHTPHHQSPGFPGAGGGVRPERLHEQGILILSEGGYAESAASRGLYGTFRLITEDDENTT
jgi:hypothetical protein